MLNILDVQDRVFAIAWGGEKSRESPETSDVLPCQTLCHCTKGNMRKTISDKRKNDPSCCFVAKSVGLMYKPELLKKLREENPNIQLIIVLRNPVERAYSAFLFCEKEGIEPYKEFEDAIFVNDISRFNGDKAFELACDYIGRSSYLQNIKKYVKVTK